MYLISLFMKLSMTYDGNTYTFDIKQKFYIQLSQGIKNKNSIW